MGASCVLPSVASLTGRTVVPRKYIAFCPTFAQFVSIERKSLVAHFFQNQNKLRQKSAVRFMFLT